jgi:hypothetical protein
VALRNVDIWKEEGQREIISRRGSMKFYQRKEGGFIEWGPA